MDSPLTHERGMQRPQSSSCLSKITFTGFTQPCSRDREDSWRGQQQLKSQEKSLPS